MYRRDKDYKTKEISTTEKREKKLNFVSYKKERTDLVMSQTNTHTKKERKRRNIT